MLMLVVERAEKRNAVEFEYLRCPVCKTGRLCDKSTGETVLTVSNDRDLHSLPRIIVKCPKCASKISIGYIEE